MTYTGILPDLFGEGEGMVGTGRLVDGTFQATESSPATTKPTCPPKSPKRSRRRGVYRHYEGNARKLIRAFTVYQPSRGRVPTHGHVPAGG